MASNHNIVFGTSSGGGAFLQLGPNPYGGPTRYHGEFKIGERSGGRRVQGIVVPFADGLKDVADGKQDGGSVTVEGWVHSTTGSAEGSAIAIVLVLSSHTDFFVWSSYAGAAVGAQKLRALQSYRISETSGWGGDRFDVSLTFAVIDPEY